LLDHVWCNVESRFGGAHTARTTRTLASIFAAAVFATSWSRRSDGFPFPTVTAILATVCVLRPRSTLVLAIASLAGS
jgi:hypothetical protein